MNAQELIAASATASANLVGTDAFYRLATSNLGVTGDALTRHLGEHDRPGLFSPIDLEDDGKDRLGALLALEGRAVIAWTVGVFRMKNVETVIPIGSITAIEHGTRPGGAMTKERERLTIVTRDRRWSMVFANMFEGGRSLVPFIAPALHGGVRPEFEAGGA